MNVVATITRAGLYSRVVDGVRHGHAHRGEPALAERYYGGPCQAIAASSPYLWGEAATAPFARRVVVGVDAPGSEYGLSPSLALT